MKTLRIDRFIQRLEDRNIVQIDWTLKKVYTKIDGRFLFTGIYRTRSEMKEDLVLSYWRDYLANDEQLSARWTKLINSKQF